MGVAFPGPDLFQFLANLVHLSGEIDFVFSGPNLTF